MSFSDNMGYVDDNAEKIRAAAGRFKSVRRDEVALRRLCRKYGGDVTPETLDNMTEEKQVAATIACQTIRRLADTGINHDLEIMEAICDARAGEEKHILTGEEPSVPRKVRRKSY